jgi:hypothetical protein
MSTKVKSNQTDSNKVSSKGNQNSNAFSSKLSTKSLEKRAEHLTKRFNQRKPRQHTQSCSVAYDVSGDEFDSQKSALSNGTKPNKGKKLYWGKPGDELSLDGRYVLDENDPIYDSDSEDRRCFMHPKKSSHKVRDTPTVAPSGDQPQSLPVSNTTKPLMPSSQRDFETRLVAWLDEYFDHSDPSEVCNLLRDLKPTRLDLIDFPGLAISLALEKKPHQRELVSRLLSTACSNSHGLLKSTTMQKAFHALLFNRLEELCVDVPDAPELVGCFLARAIADNILPPTFVSSYKGQVSKDIILRALRKAENLSKVPHISQNLDIVWVAPAGLRNADYAPPTQALTDAFSTLVKEYMDAKDKREVDRTLRELNVPHFLHELVVQAIFMVIERSTEDTCNTVIDLLSYIYTTGQCSGDMMAKGIRRVYDQLADISIDVPSAYLIMDRFLKLALISGFVSAALVKDMPTRKRPRFISENVTALNTPQ